MGKSSVSVEVEFTVGREGDCQIKQVVRVVTLDDTHRATVTAAVSLTLRADVVNRC